MQNSFEKQVQEKMDELQFVPTEPVWKNIEKQIRTKKDRRRIILWLPFLFLLLSGGAWWLATQNHADTIATIEKNREAATKSVDGKESKQPTVVNQNPSEKGNSILIQNNLQEQKQISPKDSYEPNDEHVFVKTKRPKVLTSLTASNNLSEKSSVNAGDETVVNDEVSKSKSSTIKNSNTVPSVKTDSVLHKINIKKDSSAQYKVAEVKTDNSDTAIAELKKNKSGTSKWQFGILTTAGVSGHAKSFGSFSEEKSLQDAYAAPGNGVPTPVYGPSPVKNNLSFSAGIIAKKELTKRLSFSAGLQYNYYSTKIAVGQMRRQDTTVFNSGFTQSVSRFYLNSGTNFTDYLNRYHFITLPLSVDWKVLKKTPLHLHAGVSVQQLISTNALIFDKSSRIYYADKDAFNKTQLFSSFGLSYAVFERSKTSLLLGPQLQYGISDLEKKSSGKHLFSLGISAHCFFVKTKKVVQRRL
jgi:hypothetical protein